MKFIKPILTIFLIFQLFSCNYDNSSKVENLREIKDMSGRNVSIPDTINRVIALGPGALRYLVYMNQQNKIIAIEGNEKRRFVPYLQAHPELEKLPQIGTGNIYETELLSIQKPDVLICTYMNQGKGEELQKKTGIPVILLNYGDFNQNVEVAFDALKFLGKLFYNENRADSLITYIKKNISDLESRTKNFPENQKESVYIGGVAYKGSHGLNSTEPMYAPFRFVNAINVASGQGEATSSRKAWLENAIIDKEKIINWNPQKIFLDISGFEVLKNDLSESSPFFSTLDAIKNSELYFVLPHNWYTINFENVLCNSYYIGKVLYPENFSYVEIEKKADEIYFNFLGKSVYQNMKRKFGGFRKIAN